MLVTTVVVGSVVDKSLVNDTVSSGEDNAVAVDIVIELYGTHSLYP